MTKKQQTEEMKLSQEQALRDALASAQKAMAENPCKETIEVCELANQALDRYLTKQMQTERRFKNVLDVLEYLKDQGWKIEKSKLYADRKSGKIRAHADGKFSAKDVDKYARDWLEPVDGESSEQTAQNRKLEAETKKQEAQAEWWELKSQVETGKYVPRDQFEQELAARAAFLKSDFENFFRAHASEITAMVSGDQEKVPDLLAFCLDTVADWLDRYAKQGNFTV